MTYEEAIKWFEESPFMHEGHEPYEMAINALKLVAEQTEPNSKVSETPTSSEKPNNCEDEDIFEYCPRCGMRILVSKPKTEPQTDCPKTCPSRDICTKSDADCAWK